MNIVYRTLNRVLMNAKYYTKFYGVSLESYIKFDFERIAYSVPMSSFNYKVVIYYENNLNVLGFSIFSSGV